MLSDIGEHQLGSQYQNNLKVTLHSYSNNTLPTLHLASGLRGHPAGWVKIMFSQQNIAQRSDLFAEVKTICEQMVPYAGHMEKKCAAVRFCCCSQCHLCACGKLHAVLRFDCCSQSNIFLLCSFLHFDIFLTVDQYFALDNYCSVLAEIKFFSSPRIRFLRSPCLLFLATLTQCSVRSEVIWMYRNIGRSALFCSMCR